MGSQIPSHCDCSRTNWTTSMERYFIDLMLDQMHRGNRMGHTFNKQAWTDMLTMFNAKFGCQYDRDILKSRYTNLWKQFNDVKNLLDETGFSWDDNHKMVVADASVWDAYIKAQPHAESYRNRTLMNFNDLCLIYAYTQADGRYSLSSHDFDFDDDMQGVNTGVGLGSPVLASVERSKTEWTPAMDRYFIELMLDQLKRGNKTSDRFNKQAWKDMLTLFNGKFCFQHGKSFLKRRYKKLFNYYTDIRNLLEQKGFSWDEKQQMIVADDRAWDKQIKANPRTRSYRKKTLLNYQDLGMIYGNLTDGHCGHTSFDKNFKDRMLPVKNANDGLRTIWTPLMDRYLIDVLLDEALRGNKIGHSFIPEAWTGMVMKFNVKFGSQFGGDVLKNRYRHFREQYNDIKILLEQSGFSWDDTQEMVTAEDYVWDSYTKAHPDAGSYRNRSLPSYHKLWVIYGQESSNRRYDRLSHNVDLKEREHFQSLANSGCSRAKWTPTMDRFLIDLLLDQVHKGRRINYSFNDEAWLDIAVSFVERFGLQHDKDFIRWHHKSLGKQFNAIKNLLDQKGFSWDEMQQMVTAYDDVWDNFIQEYPDAKSYRTKRSPSYNDLCLIYGMSTCNGRANQASQHISCNGDGARINNGYCWRADWTPPMDRYFIDLMLEQVRLGSMVDQKFSRQAWADMVSKFSAEFGSHYDNDILKSRFINLKKRFNDIKSLLDHSGFAWDEMRQVVTANDDLWDAYIEANPDLRSYRNRTLPNFNDLFLIYGSSNLKGRGSSFSHCMDPESDILGVTTGEEDEQSPATSDSLKTCWTEPMDSYFIDLMLEQVHRGNKRGQKFTEQAWAWMLSSFNENFELECDKNELENRYLLFLKEYNDITDLLSQNGFAWDNIQQKVTADDDVWEAYIKEYPDAFAYRDRCLDTYKDLCIIYSANFPIGRSSHLGVKLETNINATESGFDEIFGDLQAPAREFNLPEQRKKRKFSTLSTSACSRRFQSQDQEKEEAVHEKTRVAKEFTDYEDLPDSNSIESVVDALQAIPDMDDERFLEACELLEDENRVRMFLAMEVNERRKWLLKKLRR